MTYQTEFPDFPASAMPAMPDGFADRSWHNETCPCFIHEATGLVIWVEYPSPRPRFVLDQCGAFHPEAGWQFDDDMKTLARSNDWTEFTLALTEAMAAAIALRFSAGLQIILTESEFAAMRARNATLEYGGGICASHDYCDANLPMAAAFAAVMGREVDPTNSGDAGIWSKAWISAKRDHLTA